MSEDSVTKISVDQYELYAEFGMVAEKAQVLEFEAGNVALAFLTIFIDKNDITPELTEVFSHIVDDLNRKTFGAMVRQLQKTLNLSDSIIAVIDEALERRNYLTHHFFRTHNFRLFSEEGRKIMMAELKEIQAKLDKAHQMMSAISSLMIQIAGRDNLDLNKAVEMQTRGKRINI
jgi:hypothetical protein